MLTAADLTEGLAGLGMVTDNVVALTWQTSG